MSDRPAPESGPSRPAFRYLLLACITALSGAIIVVAFFRWVLPSETVPPPAPPAQVTADPSTAVVPFLNLSGNPAQEYYSDGFTEGVVDALAQVRGLRVAARTSAFAFRDVNRNARAIGVRLGVASVLEGSVRVAAGRVRVSAQLIQAADGLSLWSSAWERDLAGVFEIQQEIANAVAEALGLLLGPEGRRVLARRRTSDPEAYGEYLLGRHLWASRADERLGEALERFVAALERDSTFVPAWVGLATVYEALPRRAGFPVGEAATWGLAAGRRALQLDPDNAEAHAVLGSLFAYDREWEASEAHLRRSVELDPSLASGRERYCRVLTHLGRFAEAERHCRRAVELEPLDLHYAWALARVLERSGRWEEALATREPVRDGFPDFAEPYWEDGTLRLLMERYQEATVDLETWAGLAGLTRPELVRDVVAGIAGTARRSRGLRALSTLSGEGRVDPYLWLPLRLALGDPGAVLRELSGLVAGRHPRAVLAATDPRLATLRGDPEFGSLIEALGLASAGPAPGDSIE